MIKLYCDSILNFEPIWKIDSLKKAKTCDGKQVDGNALVTRYNKKKGIILYNEWLG